MPEPPVLLPRPLLELPRIATVQDCLDAYYVATAHGGPSIQTLLERHEPYELYACHSSFKTKLHRIRKLVSYFERELAAQPKELAETTRRERAVSVLETQRGKKTALSWISTKPALQ